MSPLRRRKSRTSRARARREALIQRERQEYGREQADVPAEEPVEPEETFVEGTEAPVEEKELALEPIEEPVEPEETFDEPDAPAGVPEEEASQIAPRPSRPRRRREFQPPSRVARRPRRQPRRRRRRLRVRRPDLGGIRAASTSGARATVSHTAPGIRRFFGWLVHVVGWLLAWPLRLGAFVARLITSLVRGIRGFGAGALELAERLLTPERVLVAVTIAAAGCLAYSQFVAYRGVEVGQPQYVGVSTIAPPPQTDRIAAGDAHAYVLLPLAAIAIVIALIALVRRRWQLGRLISVIGVAGIAISLAIDLPKGLDAGTAGLAFAGAKATLTDGFYAQVAASAALVLCGWVLAVNLRGPSGAKAGRGRIRRRGLGPRRTPSVARGGA